MTTADEMRASAALDSPYVGLTPFTEESAPIFFGRDAERTLLISNLRASRLTLLYAESGAGKSSLLRAGVAVRLRELAQRSFRRWGTPRHIPVVFSSWQNDPTEGLIEEIHKSVTPFLPASSSSGSLHQTLEEAVEAASAAADATLLLMLDQFEQYCLYRSAETREQRFAEELAACVERGGLRANILISIREDAYSGLGDLFKGRIGNVYGNYLHLEHLSRDSARLAIEKPIESFNRLHDHEPPLEIEQRLIDAVLDQFDPDHAVGQGGPGTLRDRNGGGHYDDSIAAPYLQLVMRRLWEAERNDGSRYLRKATLTRLGGAQTIVRTHVDRALEGLAQPERDAAAEMFRRLITPSGAKFALAAADLADDAGRSETETAALLERFAGGDTRILRPVPPAPGSDGGPRYEISHDLLAPGIIAWYSERRARRLEEEKKKAQQEAQAEELRARRFRALAAGAAALLALTVCLLVLVFINSNAAHKARDAAEAQRNRAISAQVAGESEALALHEPLIAQLLALAAWRIAHTAQASASLLNALAQPDGCVLFIHQGYAPLHSVAFSSDGRELVTAGPADAIQIWNVPTCHQAYTMSFSGITVNSVTLSSDGRTLAVALADGEVQLLDMTTRHYDGAPIVAGSGSTASVAFTRNGKFLATADAAYVRLWDVATHHLIGSPLRVGSANVTAMAFSEDGRTLATAGADGMVRLWRLPSDGLIHAFKASRSGAVYSVVLSPDGQILATAGADGTARLWYVATGRERGAPLAASASAVRSVAFSPDGRILVTAGDDGITRLWMVATGEQMRGASLTVGAIPVNSVAFSPDGETLATADADGTARLWSPTIFHQIGLGFAAGQAAAYSLAFSPHGNLLATGGAHGVVQLWQVPDGRLIRAFRASLTSSVDSVAFSRDGRVLATGSVDGVAALWHVPDGRLIRAFKASRTGAVYSVAFSPDSRVLVTAGADGSARLWSEATGREKGLPLAVSAVAVRSVAFSPDGSTFATASADGLAQLWNVASQRPEGDAFLTNLPLDSVAFGLGGRILATGGDDGTVRLWQATAVSKSDPSRQIGAPLAMSTQVNSVVFSEDGRVLATGSADGMARLWDVATGQEIGVPLAAGPGPVTGVALSPDGELLATASPVGGTLLWNVGLPQNAAGRLCAIVHTRITPRQWETYIPSSEPFRQVCP